MVQIFETLNFKELSSAKNDFILRINCKDLNKINNINENTKDLLKGFWIDKSKFIELNEILETNILTDLKSILILDSSISSAIDNDQFAALNNTFNVYFYYGSKVKSSNYEKHFYDYSLNCLNGVCFDIDLVSKGLVALANKFNLEPIIVNAKYERHLEVATNLNVDKVLVTGS
ncbi:MAG: hypothetical protein U0R17_00520 [Acidimicrobiia bacterium]